MKLLSLLSARKKNEKVRNVYNMMALVTLSDFIKLFINFQIPNQNELEENVKVERDALVVKTKEKKVSCGRCASDVLLFLLLQSDDTMRDSHKWVSRFVGSCILTLNKKKNFEYLIFRNPTFSDDSLRHIFDNVQRWYNRLVSLVSISFHC